MKQTIAKILILALITGIFAISPITLREAFAFDGSDLGDVFIKRINYAMVGSKATLSVEAKCSNPVSCEWYKGRMNEDTTMTGVPKLTETSKTLRFDKVTKDDFGVYTVIVRDGTEWGLISCELRELTYGVVNNDPNRYHNNMLVDRSIRVADEIADKITYPAEFDGNVTYITTLPKGDYRYIWTGSYHSVDELVPMTDEDLMNYNSLDNSIKATYVGDNDNSTVRCYAVPCNIYDEYEEISNIHKEIETAKASGDNAATLKAIKELRTAELNVINRAEYEEMIIMPLSIVKYSVREAYPKIGEAITLEIPEHENANRYTWTVNGVQRGNDKTLLIDSVDIQDFGVAECEVRTGTRGDYSYYRYIFNMKYTSDLTASADKTVKVNIGDKNVELKVNTTSSLPLKYTWSKNTDVSVDGTIVSNVMIIPEITEEHIAKLDDKGQLQDNYYICVVTDGIDTKEVKIGIASDGSIIDEVSTRYHRPVEISLLGKPAHIYAVQKTNSIELSWDEVPGATHYKVYYAKNGRWNPYTPMCETNKFKITELSAGTNYSYAVKAYKINDYLTQRASTFAKATFKTAPGLPSTLKVGRGYTSIKLTWKPAVGATGHRVYIRKNGKWVVVKKATTANTYTIKGLKSGATYEFAIRGYRIEGSKVIWADTYRGMWASTVAKKK